MILADAILNDSLFTGIVGFLLGSIFTLCLAGVFDRWRQ